MPATCELCTSIPGQLVWEDARCRAVLIDEAGYPGFCRVIWRDHVAEMSDLSRSDREQLMQVVWAVESALRTLMKPAKMNLASFGNMVPHLHWHVIPRFADDRHFPQSVWGVPQREGVKRAAPDLDALRAEVRRRLQHEQ